MRFQRILFAKRYGEGDCNCWHYVRNILMDVSNLSQAAERQRGCCDLHMPRIQTTIRYVAGESQSRRLTEISKRAKNLANCILAWYPPWSRVIPIRAAERAQNVKRYAFQIYSDGVFWCLPSSQIFTIGWTICCDYFIVICEIRSTFPIKHTVFGWGSSIWKIYWRQHIFAYNILSFYHFGSFTLGDFWIVHMCTITHLLFICF